MEGHVLDLEDDLYNQRLRVEFIEKIRAEKRFESAEELVQQIQRDIHHARDLLQR